MDSYSEVRRVRKQLSARAGHNIRTLIASINRQWPDEAAHTIDLGTKAEQCDGRGAADSADSERDSSPAAR
jgi:hypothetical protein